MSYTIGFAGKGGTGKTTIASIVIRYLAERKETTVLAVDADPNSNLGEMLGLKAEETVVDIIDDIAANIGNLPAGATKERLIESRVQQSLGEGKGSDLLVMGRPEGPGCYCYANSLLREVIGRLERAYRYIVIDNEAGMEHLSRRTDRKIDYFFIVSDPTVFGIRSAKRILGLARELKVATGMTHLVINRINKDITVPEGKIAELGVDKVDYVNESNSILKINAEGRPITELGADSDVIKSVYRICEGAGWR